MSLRSSRKTPLSSHPTTSSPQLGRRTMSTTPTFSPSYVPNFGSRRGNIKFSSGRFGTPSTTRSSSRSKAKGSLFRSTRRTAARPARTKGVFENLLEALTDGIEAVRGCVSDMKTRLPGDAVPGSRVNYYMELEKQIKALERKIRTLEVHKDRIEEMRDEYLLKLKLRDGAFNLAQALATQTSKAAKDKLQEARAEQRDLLEDLCDIEDELETKLGVFNVHINGLVGLGRSGSGDTFEAQLKLGTQKWKARCKTSRQQQIWQDADIIFLGKITDELFVKVVEVRRIQGNANVGCMRCQTRQLFSFYPLQVIFNFPNSNIKLNMDVRWSPVIGEDFLSDLDLHTIHCLVGGHASKLASRPSSLSNVARLNLYPEDSLVSGLNPDTTVHQIRIITESDGDDGGRSSNSYDRMEVKTHHLSSSGKCHTASGANAATGSSGGRKSPSKTKKHKTKRDSDSEFVFVDRQSVMLLDDNTIRDLPEAKELMEKQDRPPAKSPSPEKCLATPLRGSRSSLDSSSQGSECFTAAQARSPQVLMLVSSLEAVMGALEEPRELYSELKTLELQLSRLEHAFKGGRLIKAPSMTLSESQAMDSFDFLTNDDAELIPRFSRASFSDPLEDHLGHSCSGMAYDRRRGSTPKAISDVSHDREFHQTSFDNQSDDVFSSGYHEGTGTTISSFGTYGEDKSTGMESVDRALVQHLVHCEYLLQHLQSAGPLNCKLTSGLKKLQQEAVVISELLNLAAEPTGSLPQLGQILPELAANEQLVRFWRSVARDDILSVSYEEFAVALDEKFGQSLWSDFPEVTNKVFSELLNHILDLDVLEYGPEESKMVVTVFQYASYFLSQGSGILKCMREVAQDLQITGGLDSPDEEAKHSIASQLLDCGYNRGALLASAHLLAHPSTSLQRTAVKYLQRFAGNSPWHTKAVQYYIELLEHTDQTVRIGACGGLGALGAQSSIRQLRYLAKRDFTPVKSAACKALVALGEPDPSSQSSSGDERSVSGLSVGAMSKQSSTKSLLHPHQYKKKGLHRTRSADTALNSDNVLTHL